MSDKTYIERTRGIMTSSKLKDFIKSPLLFKVKYIDEVDIDESDKRHFVVGSAFDTLVSYGKDKFLEKYYIDKGYVVADLKEKLQKEKGMEYEYVKNLKLPELRAIYYDNQDEQKIRLTPTEGNDIMGMYAEVLKQPLCDMGNENYQTQYEIHGEFKGVKVGGTLDRIDEKAGLVRDWKTSGQIERFEENIADGFDYSFQMAFYYVLAYVKLEKECDVILDVISKKAPYAYLGYKLGTRELRNKVKNVIVPALEYYVECMKTNKRPHVNVLYFDQNGERIPAGRDEFLTNPYYPYLGLQQDFFLEP